MAKSLDLNVSSHLRNSTADAIGMDTVEERIVDHVPPMDSSPKGEKEKNVIRAMAKNDQEPQISSMLSDTAVTTSTRERIQSYLRTLTTFGSNASRNRRNSLVSTTTFASSTSRHRRNSLVSHRRNSLVSTTTAGSLIEELLLDFDVDISVPRYKKRSLLRRGALSTFHHPPFELDLHDSYSTFSCCSQELANKSEEIQSFTPGNEATPSMKDDQYQSIKDETLQSKEKIVKRPSFFSVTRQTPAQYSNCRAKSDFWLDEKVSKQRKCLKSNIRKVFSLTNLHQSKAKSSSMTNMQVFLQSSPFLKIDQSKQQERRGSKLMVKRFRSFSFQNEEEDDNILLKNLKEMDESNLLNVIRLEDDDMF